MAQVHGSVGSSAPLYPDGKAGVWGETDFGYAVTGTANSGNGVQGGSIGGFGAVGTSDSSIGVLGITRASIGVSGASSEGVGVWGTGNAYGVFGEGSLNGVIGRGTDYYGVTGIGASAGVYGKGDSGNGVLALSKSAEGLVVYSDAMVAARIHGAVYCESLVTQQKLFKIDHPLDPTRKYLNHFSVESSEMRTLYDGLATLDEHGEAIVVLPKWFEALNADVRYQLTCIGSCAPVYVADPVSDNRFRIAGGTPGLEVSWQLTGRRNDRSARAADIPIEEAKLKADIGYYIDPRAFGKSRERVVSLIHRPRGRKHTRNGPRSSSLFPEPTAPKDRGVVVRMLRKLKRASNRRRSK